MHGDEPRGPPFPEIGFLDDLSNESEQVTRQHYGVNVFNRFDIATRDTIDEIFAQVEAGRLEAGVVPEFHTTRNVEETLNGYYRRNVHLIGKQIVPITYSIRAVADTSTDTIREVMGLEQAFSDCSVWLGENVPDAKLTPSNGLYWIGDRIHDADDRYLAVIETGNGLRDTGLPLLAQDIGNFRYSAEFGIIRPGPLTPENMPEPTGDDETHLIIRSKLYSNRQVESYLNILRYEGIYATIRPQGTPEISLRTSPASTGRRPAYVNKLLDAFSRIKDDFSISLGLHPHVYHFKLRGHLSDDNFKSALNKIKAFENVTIKNVGTYART